MTTDRNGDPGAAERGRPARVDRDGSVHGSGSGAGGGGTPEDLDADAASGDSGNLQPRHRAPAEQPTPDKD
jgi:hypothetical protein